MEATIKPKFSDRESWLTAAANKILSEIIMPEVGDAFPRPTFRISVGFPKHTRGAKSIAVCFVRRVSNDGVNEIFINPEIDYPMQVLESVAHELIHATDDCASGHRNYFAKTARAIGLEGKFTATYAGPALVVKLQEYIDALGEFPHVRMVVDSGRKKDGTRQLKVGCTECDFIFRTSQKHIDNLMIEAPCPCCGEGYLEQI